MAIAAAFSGVAANASPLTNPLIGTWMLERHVDTPEGGQPVYTLGEKPVGIMIFTADGHVSINMMRNPPADADGTVTAPSDDQVPSWYASYFGTYSYDSKGTSWTTHVLGGNVKAYLGTDQTRAFRLEGDALIISSDYQDRGKSIHAERVFRRVAR